jgi:RNase P/RNase MRP subunit p30
MKHNLNDQFTSDLRVDILLSKYSLPYLKEVINGLIRNAKNRGEIIELNYWNEVALEIKKRIV